MTKDDILVKLQEILASEFEIDPATVKLEALLYEDLELDSIDAVDLLVKMKELQGIIPGKIEPALFKDARTVQDVVNLLFPLVRQP
jgi:acyl carrier protein